MYVYYLLKNVEEGRNVTFCIIAYRAQNWTQTLKVIVDSSLYWSAGSLTEI